MELRHLRYFVAVAEELHFGRAAERLHMAQSPLSQQVRQLEAAVGVELFRRTTRRVELTDAGAAYLAKARGILVDVEVAAQDARRAAHGDVGRLSIGFTGSATYELLPRVARGLRTVLPGVELELHGELLTPRQVEALREHGLDLGFIRPPARDPFLAVEVLRQEKLVAVLPRHHRLADRPRLALADLRDDPFISYPSRFRSVTHDAVIEACARAGFYPTIIQQVQETSTLVAFVAGGLGVALVPESVRHLQITGASYHEVEGPGGTVDLALAYRADDASPVLARALAAIRAATGGAI